ncbi:MAG: hypothetical protein MN733_36470 [Nitrososphaera sp.]|nr:hypothetical protein [Nitrososphaera sp.]
MLDIREMMMFRKMKEMWQEARGSVLRKELDDAIMRLSGVGDDVKLRASLAMADAFHKLTQKLGSLANVSNDGKKKIAAQLNEEGKQSFDFDMGHAYGLALLSMLVEAEALPGDDAKYVHRMTLEILQAAPRHFEGGTEKGQDKADVAIETAVTLLQVQIALGNTEENDEFNERLIDSYSRGYIFGLCDALLQSAGVNNDGKAIGVITIVHLKLFGEDSGATIVGQSLRDQEVELFIKGRMRGGQELIEFFTNKTPPMGLAGYLLNGEM